MKKRKWIKRILIAVAVIAVLICIIAYGITHSLMKQNFGRGEYSVYSYGYRYSDYENEYPRRQVSFQSGENTLYGYVYGEENEKGLVVFSHGIGGGHEGYLKEILWFVDQGYSVFAFDNTGSCESEGEGTTGLSQSALDLNAALCFVENDAKLCDRDIFLCGHSWGGFAVTAVLNFDHDIVASASIAGYAKPLEMIMEFAGNIMDEKMAAFAHPFIRLYNWRTFGKYAELSAVDGINKNNVPVLIIHGNMDETISYDHASIIAKKDEITNPNVQYLTLSEAGCNGHNTIFYSKDASIYRARLNEAYNELKETYDGDIPEDVKKDFYENVDKERANVPNWQMMDAIDTFFENAAKK